MSDHHFGDPSFDDHDPGDDPGHDPGHDDFGVDHLGAEHVEADYDGGDHAGAGDHDYGAGYDDTPAGDHDLNTGGDTGGPDLTHETGDEPYADEPDLTPEHGPEGTVGADPDLTPEPDDGRWYTDVFPPPLDVHTPEPVDGYPWTDPATLGTDAPQSQEAQPEGPEQDTPPASDLIEYAAEDTPDGDPWTALAGSDDPATSTLARFWNNPQP